MDNSVALAQFILDMRDVYGKGRDDNWISSIVEYWYQNRNMVKPYFKNLKRYLAKLDCLGWKKFGSSSPDWDSRDELKKKNEPELEGFLLPEPNSPSLLKKKTYVLSEFEMDNELNNKSSASTPTSSPVRKVFTPIFIEKRILTYKDVLLVGL